MTANSIIGEGTLTKFKLIQAFIFALVICKNEEDQFKIESTRVVTTDLPLKVYGDFSRRSRAVNSVIQNLIWRNFKAIQAFIVVFVTYRNVEAQIKNEGARVVTRLSIDFSNAQGQLTPKTLMGSRQNSNSSELL